MSQYWAVASLLKCSILYALGIAIASSTAQEIPGVGTNTSKPLSSYMSRPDILAPFLNVTVYDATRVTPGYLFLAPYQTTQNAIYMYDNTGNLVWSGHAQTGPGNSHNFQVCGINTTSGVTVHLCYYTGAQGSGYGRGFVNILDSTLTTVSSVRSQNGLSNLDEHEFNVVDDGTAALTTLYNPERTDLTAYNVSSGQGWITNCYFQKLEIGTNNILFEWNAFDHVPLSDSYVQPNSSEVAGTGFSALSPWDYFHINAVDQSSVSGNYLISARHTSTIYQISSVDGSVIWRLGGKSSDFTFDQGLNFTFQHDARYISENSSTIILSLFDNASNGYSTQSSSYSSGKIIKLDFTVSPPHASLLKLFIAPTQFVSTSQGNLQLMNPGTDDADWSTSNAFMGWGSQAYLSEYAPDGTIIQQAYYATIGAMSYRIYKFNFTTNPPDAPALYTYSRYGNSSTNSATATTVFYMSWNGATQVSKWNIYGRQSTADPWTLLTNDPVTKTGFETVFTATSFWGYGMVEALDGQGIKLRNSSYGSGSSAGGNLARGVKTFVPGSVLAANCDGYGCAVASSYSTDGKPAGDAETGSGSGSGSKNGAGRVVKGVGIGVWAAVLVLGMVVVVL